MAEPGNGGDKTKGAGVVGDDPANKIAGLEDKIGGPSETANAAGTEESRRAILLGEFLDTGKVSAISQDKTGTTGIESAPVPGIVPDVRTAEAEQGSESKSEKVAETTDPKENLERLGSGLHELEENLRRLGLPTDTVQKVRLDLTRTDPAKIDLTGSRQIVERLNRSASQGQLKEHSVEVLLKMVEANLADRIGFVTAENVESATTGNKIFNRENPAYRIEDTNCRACSASYVINEALPEKALMIQFDSLVERLAAGDLKADKVQVPVENGVPKMSAIVFQRLYGNTHNGTAGEKLTQREVSEFRRVNESVPRYIQRGLESAGFSNVQLTKSVWPTTTPGFYILEHPTPGGGSVEGHVSVGYVDENGRAHRIDRQNPEINTANMLVSDAYRINFDGAALEQQITMRTPGDTKQEIRTRAINPDGTVRDLRVQKGTLTGFTDVDGTEYSRDSDGKWKARSGIASVGAPFSEAEYLGAREGMKFSFGNLMVTEKPSGLTDVQIPDRAVVVDGKPLTVNNVEVKLGDLLSKVSRSRDGKWQVSFHDGTTVDLFSDTTSSDHRRSAAQLGEALARGTTGDSKTGGIVTGAEGGAGLIDRAVQQRIAQETAGGAALDKAIVKIGQVDNGEGGLERLTRLEAALMRANLPYDPRSLARFDRVKTHMGFSEADLPRAHEIVKRAEAHAANGTTLKKDGPLLTETQALDLAMLEATTDPARGKPYNLNSALARLRVIEEMRTETAGVIKEITVPQGLEMLRIKDLSLKDSTMSSDNAKMSERSKLLQQHRLVTQPELLKAAEALMASHPSFTLTDAVNIASVSDLRSNPERAAELITETRILRQGLALDGGTSLNGSFRTVELLRIAQFMKDNNIPVSSKKIKEVQSLIAAGRTAGDGKSLATAGNGKSADAVDGKLEATANDGKGAAAAIDRGAEIAARVKPIADALKSSDATVVTIDRLERTRELLGKEKVVRGDSGQSNVFNLLNHADPKVGILAKLKEEGKISPAWEVYPTEMGSPADKVGADFLLVNKETGAFHMLDATQRGEKPNIYALRAAGVIAFDREVFDLSGRLKLPLNDGSLATDIEQVAEDFKADLEKQIREITESKTPFKLGETPIGDVRKTTAEATRTQVEALSRWAQQQGIEAGETERSPGQFMEMSAIVDKALRHQEIVLTQQTSARLDTQVKRVLEKEIAKFVYSELVREPYAELPKGEKSNVYYHHKSDTLNLETAEKEHFVSPDIRGTIVDTMKGMHPTTFLANLSNSQLKKLGIEGKDFKGADTASAFKAAYDDIRHPQHEKVKFQADRLANKMTSLRAEIVNGGLRGEGKHKPIVENVVRTLTGRTDGVLIGRETAPAPLPVAAQSFRAGTDLLKEMPSAAEQLTWLYSDKVEGGKPVASVIDAMDLLIEEQKSKATWSAEELERFERLRLSYRAGDPGAVERVHDWINNRQSIVEQQSGENKYNSGPDLPEPRQAQPKVGQEGAGPPRPDRQALGDINLNRSHVDMKTDGTRELLDPQSPIGKLGWDKRLTNDEIKGILDAKQALEERVKKGEVLRPEEAARLESLRFFEANLSKVEVHRQIIEQVGARRPTGGFKPGQAGSSLMAVGILTLAVLHTQEASAAPTGRPARARYGN